MKINWSHIVCFIKGHKWVWMPGKAEHCARCGVIYMPGL